MSENLEKLCKSLLTEIGEDPEREGLVRTPARYTKAIKELTAGYDQTVEEIVGTALFEEDISEMVLVKNIEFYSLCEHHILPFFGKAHVAYIPNGKIIGLSKIPRIVKMFARRLQVQERLTEDITKSLNDLLQPHGVACMIEASHMSTMMRGIHAQNSKMVTSSMKGQFLKSPMTRDEFLSLAKD